MTCSYSTLLIVLFLDQMTLTVIYDVSHMSNTFIQSTRSNCFSNLLTTLCPTLQSCASKSGPLKNNKLPFVATSLLQPELVHSSCLNHSFSSLMDMLTT